MMSNPAKAYAQTARRCRAAATLEEELEIWKEFITLAGDKEEWEPCRAAAQERAIDTEGCIKFLKGPIHPDLLALFPHLGEAYRKCPSVEP